MKFGYGLEGAITDGKAGRILDDYVIPYFKDDNWDDGIENGFNAILSEVCKEYDVTIDGANEAVADEVDTLHVIMTIIIIFIILYINFKFGGGRRGFYYYGGSGHSSRGGSFHSGGGGRSRWRWS